MSHVRVRRPHSHPELDYAMELCGGVEEERWEGPADALRRVGRVALRGARVDSTGLGVRLSPVALRCVAWGAPASTGLRV